MKNLFFFFFDRKILQVLYEKRARDVKRRRAYFPQTSGERSFATKTREIRRGGAMLYAYQKDILFASLYPLEGFRGIEFFPGAPYTHS
jgi:hypothetical protein